jgi:L-amino acid N-acyltransferase YncA
MTHGYTTRLSAPKDIEAITGIYSHYVRTSSATFELEPPSLEEMGRRRQATLDLDLPHLVALADERVIGYAYAALYRQRPAYKSTVEDSIYVDPEWSGRGIGRLLLSDLICNCEMVGRRQMIAVIGDPANNAASIGLHRAFGFQEVGTLQNVGYKLERWLDTLLMQRSLAGNDSSRPQ